MSQDRLSTSVVGRELIEVTGAPTAREAMELLARRALDDAEISKFPIDLEQVASFRHVRHILKTEMSQAGRLVPRDGWFEIHVRRGDAPERQRFTIGHEIGHTLIPSYAADPYLVDDEIVGGWSGVSRAPVEELCAAAAAELLMPMHLFGPMAAGYGCGLNSVDALRQNFNASWPAVARRLVETSLWPCALVAWSFNNDIPRVKYAITSTDFGHHLPPGLSAPSDGCLAQHFLKRQANTLMEELTFDGMPTAFAVHVKRPPREGWSETPNRTLLSLLLPYPRGSSWPGQRTIWPAATARPTDKQRL